MYRNRPWVYKEAEDTRNFSYYKAMEPGSRIEISHFDTESARTSVWNCNVSLTFSE